MDCLLFDAVDDVLKARPLLEVHGEHPFDDGPKLVGVPGVKVIEWRHVGIEVELFGFRVVVVDGSQIAYLKNDHGKDIDV